MRSRTRYSLITVLLLLLALGIALFLRGKAPPEAARLLPESDAIIYANLKPLRSATHFDRNPVEHSPDYQQFIDATGIVPERDLDDVAFALHRMDDPSGPNGPVAYSEVFEGRFDGQRLNRYLARIASSHEQYAGHDIYTIPVGDPVNGGGQRQLRIAQLGYDTLAASNMPTAEQIHSMLDRHRAAASPFAGSSLLSERFGDVPLLAGAWAIGHVGLPFSEDGKITVLGLQLPFPEDTTFVASLRFLGPIRLRVEEISPDDAAATRATATMTTLLGLVKSIEGDNPRETPDRGLREALDSLKVEQHHDRAVVTGTVLPETLRKLTSASGNSPEK